MGFIYQPYVKKESGMMTSITVLTIVDGKKNAFVENWKDANAIDFHCNTDSFKGLFQKS